MRKLGKTLAAVIAVAMVGFPAAAMAADTTITVTKGGTTATTIQAGDTINVTNSSPIDVSGQLKQTLASVWSKESLQLTDTSSIVAPDGWTVEYQDSADTWTSTAPGDLSTVSGLRAVGDIQSNGDNVFVTVAKSRIVVRQENFQGSSGGDGYDLTFGGDYVFNVFHHDGQVRIDCHVKASGESCFGGINVFSGYSTGNADSSYWDGTKSRLWVSSMRQSDNQGGFTCVDYSKASPTFCPTEFVPLGQVDNAQALGISTRVGDQAYVVNGTSFNLMCLNIKAGTACANNGFQLPSAGYNPNVYGYGRASSAGDGKVYWSTYNKMGCYNPATNTLCGSAIELNTQDTQYPLFPVRNASGTLLGMCEFSTKQCISPAGESVDVISPAMASWMTDHPLPSITGANVGQWAEQGNRIYINDGFRSGFSDDVSCFNYSTGAACDGFAGTNVGTRIYSIIADPAVPNCLWTNGDAGQITTFNGKTGVLGCTMEFPLVEMPYTAIAPRMACDETGRLLTWGSMKFNAPAGITTSQLKVSIYDTNGNPIDGWTEVSPNAQGVIDMKSLSVAVSGTKPSLQVSAGSVDKDLLAQLTATVNFEAAAPQLCFDLHASAKCPEFTPAQGDLSVADGLIQVIAVSTNSAGKAVAAGEASATLQGTNTDAVCKASIQKLGIPDVPIDPVDPGDPEEPVLAETGGDTGVLAMVAAAILMLVSGSVLVIRARR